MTPAPRGTRALGSGGHWSLSLPALALTGVAFAWPLVEVGRLAAAKVDVGRLWTSGYREDLVFTLLTSLAAAATATVIGFLLAVRLHGTSGPGQAVVTGLALAPLLVPHLVAAYAVRLLLSPAGPLARGLLGGHAPDLVASPISLVAALVWKFLPFAFLNAWAARATVSPELLEAAADGGASFLRRGLEILLPLMAPGLMAGGLLVFVLAAAQFSITIVAYSGTSITTIPMDVYFLAEGEGDLATGAALGVAYAALVVALSVAGQVLIRRRSHAIIP